MKFSTYHNDLGGRFLLKMNCFQLKRATDKISYVWKHKQKSQYVITRGLDADHMFIGCIEIMQKQTQHTTGCQKTISIIQMTNALHCYTAGYSIKTKQEYELTSIIVAYWLEDPLGQIQDPICLSWVCKNRLIYFISLPVTSVWLNVFDYV